MIAAEVAKAVSLEKEKAAEQLRQKDKQLKALEHKLVCFACYLALHGFAVCFVALFFTKGLYLVDGKAIT